MALEFFDIDVNFHQHSLAITAFQHFKEWHWAAFATLAVFIFSINLLNDFILYPFMQKVFSQMRIIQRIIDFSFLQHRVVDVPLQKGKYFLYIIARPFKQGSSSRLKNYFFPCFAEKGKKYIVFLVMENKMSSIQKTSLPSFPYM